MVVETSALHDIARVLNASASVHDAALVVTESAVATFRASGGYVELVVAGDDAAPQRRMAIDGADRQVEVVATVGDGVPPLGLRVPYPGSLTPRTAQSPEPPATADASYRALVVPLVSDGQAQGALVLRRRETEEPFTSDDATGARALGDLAAAALRRAALDEALRKSEERFRQIADHIREFIWLSDPSFTRHFYVNAAYEQIWGRDRASLYADPSSLVDGVHPDDRARVTAALAGMLRGEYDIEYRVVRPDGDIRWVASRGVPVLDDRGELYRIAGITEDITERKLAEIERRQLLERERAARDESEEARAIAEQRRQELERVTESRTRLLRGFTHDVKNPLGAADGFLALLAEGVRGDLTAQQLESVGRARRSIRSALDLIGHLLELARAAAGQLEIRCVATDLRELASELVEEFRAQAETKQLSLAAELPPELPAIESDPARIRQVLANLVSNAVKYTPNGGRITVRAGVRSGGAAPVPGEWVVVDVIDTGAGIAADKRQLLFQEFTRFDPGAAHGAGIGLAISQRVAQALGGAISVESEMGVGSTFTLWLSQRNPLPPSDAPRAAL